jgi:hypothetical protein
MECNFTIKHYRETIALAKQKGYVFSIMRDYDKNIHHEKVIFMRHDVDMSIPNAMRFAEMENELGIKATYFIRLHCDYNIFSFRNYKFIKLLLKSGHEIGFHHEVDFSRIYEEDEKEFFSRARKVLETVTGTKIAGVTPHEPSRIKTLVNEGNLKEFGMEYEGYSSKFTKDIKYISDSSCRWREGCMCEFIKKETPKLCILVHPFWWYEQTPLENY